jgi:phosphatidylserine/phosphatidylglycerophosphate/cardiolipin synthase-like enzyme
MREKTVAGELTLHAVSGTHGVLLGFDVPSSALPTLLGFAVQRTLLPDGEPEYLPNFLRFAINDRPDGPWSTRENPLQAFQWGDYTVTPEQHLRYRVSMVTGTPGKVTLTEPAAEIEIATEPSDDGHHGVWFNRGIAGSQAYARKFGGVSPLGVPDAETWLSRGLREALLAFIARAQGPGQKLRGAFYEFSYPPILDALRDAARRGVDVALVVADPADPHKWPISPACENAQAIAATKAMENRKPFVRLITARHATSGIAHDKFLVLLEGDDPVAVWTGSTNITAGALLGHSNLGHMVSDPAIAKRYLDFWTSLHGDPDRDASRVWVDANSPVPDVADAPPFLPPGIDVVFSPHTDPTPLERYVELMHNAHQAMFLTAPFGLGEELEKELAIDRHVPRYVLVDKPRDDLPLMTSDPSLSVVFGAYLGQPGGYRQFLQERLTGLNPQVRFVHTKYLLVDPLTDHPVLITGSANFSPASTIENDENMLWISGEQRLADIYLTEFMRLFTHFRFRDALKADSATKAPGPKDPDVEASKHLDEQFKWSEDFFVDGSPKQRERLLFSGQL